MTSSPSGLNVAEATHASMTPRLDEEIAVPKKKKPQKMSLVAFQSWADDTDQSAAAVPDVDNFGSFPPISSSTATSKGQGTTFAASSVTTQRKALTGQPPYTAFVGNLAYIVESRDLEQFFRGLRITNVRLPREGDRSKGFGYVEFATQEDLRSAISRNGESLLGRTLKVDAADVPFGAGGGAPPVSSSSTYHRSSDFGSFGGSSEHREEPAHLEDDWRGQSKFEPSQMTAPTNSSFGSRKGPSHAGWNPDESSRLAPPRAGWGFREGGPHSYHSRDGGDSAAVDRAKERPRLTLEPRTKPAPVLDIPKSERANEVTGRSDPVAVERRNVSEAGLVPDESPEKVEKKKTNPFGQAKPRDENEMLRRVEERLKQRDQSKPEKASEKIGETAAHSDDVHETQEPRGKKMEVNGSESNEGEGQPRQRVNKWTTTTHPSSDHGSSGEEKELDSKNERRTIRNDAHERNAQAYQENGVAGDDSDWNIRPKQSTKTGHGIEEDEGQFKKIGGRQGKTIDRVSDSARETFAGGLPKASSPAPSFTASNAFAALETEQD